MARRRGLPGFPAWGGVNDAWLEDGGEGEGDVDKGAAAKRACALGHIINDPQGSATGRANVQFKVRVGYHTSGFVGGAMCRANAAGPLDRPPHVCG